MEKVDRKAILSGDLEIYLKEKTKYLNGDWKICPVSNVIVHECAIVEKDGRCYMAVAFDSYNLTGLLYETRDSFDELVAQYKGKEIAGSNASETEE